MNEDERVAADLARQTVHPIAAWAVAINAMAALGYEVVERAELERLRSIEPLARKFLRRWDNPEIYHRLPVVDDLRAAVTAKSHEGVTPE